MNAIDFLNEQHDLVDELFAKIHRARTTDAKTALFEQLGDALAIHATIEEKLFYPAVKARRTEEILLEALEEHLAIKRVLADLLEIDATDESFDAKMEVLQEQVEHHVEEEKSELFPKVEKLFDATSLDQLGEQLEAMADALEGNDARLGVPSEIGEAAPLP